jgi:hypothetical protein
MSGVVSLNGAQLVASPACNQGSAFPTGIDNITIDLNPPSKPWTVKTGDMQANVNNVSFAAVGGIGASGPVTHANTFFIRATAPGMKVLLTFADSSTATLNLAGELLYEAATGIEITGVQVQGSGLIEYWASGPS